MLALHRVGPIGIDFGSETIKLVQADFSKNGPRIRAAMSQPYSASRDQFLLNTSAVKNMIKASREAGFRGERAVVAIPSDRVQFVSLEYKYRNGQDEEEAVVSAIQERFGERLGQSVVDYLQIRPDHKEQHDRTALVALAERDQVISLLEVLRKSGLDVGRLEIGPTAINRLIAAMHPEQTENVSMVINFGVERSYATVLWGRRLLLDRSLNFGSRACIQQLSDALQIDASHAHELLETHGVQVMRQQVAGSDIQIPGVDETITDILKPSFLQLTTELKRLMLYIASRTRGRNVQTAYLFGSLASWPGIESILSDMIGIPLRRIRPFYGLPTTHHAAKTHDHDALRGIAVATGLALLGGVEDA